MTGLIVSVAYFLGAKIGMMLTMPPQAVSTLWPPNAILLGALLVTPPRSWWVILLAAFPAHLAVELGSGLPPAMVLCWFVSNCSEALIGAACVRLVRTDPLRLDSFRRVGLFALATSLAVFLSSFIDIGWLPRRTGGTNSRPRSTWPTPPAARPEPDAGKIDQHLPGLLNQIDPGDDGLFLPLVTQPICLKLARALLGEGFQMTEVGCRWRKPGAPSGPVRLTRPISYLGLPVVSANAGFTKAGMPIGLQLIAPPRDEATALQAAHALSLDQSFQDATHRDPGLV
jgi:hypothetical protein